MCNLLQVLFIVQSRSSWCFTHCTLPCHITIAVEVTFTLQVYIKLHVSLIVPTIHTFPHHL